MKPLAAIWRVLSRRRFLGSSARGLGAIAVVASSGRPARAAAGSADANPYAYDISAHQKTDPRLIKYTEARRFKSPRAGARRLALVGVDRLGLAAGNGVVLLDFAGAMVGEIAVGAPVRCLAAAADGTIYVSVREHVEVFDAGGQRRATWDSPGAKTWFSGLAVGLNDVYAADSGNRVVLRYDRSGRLVGRLGEKDPTRNIPGLVLPSPYLDVKLTAEGLVCVNNPGRHRVELYSPAGDLQHAWGRPSIAIDGFCGCCNPVAVAPLPDGRVVTCEKGLPRVKVSTAQGELDGVVAGPESFPENARIGAGETLSDGTKSSLDAVVDPRGSVWVLDTVTGDLREFTRNSGVKS